MKTMNTLSHVAIWLVAQELCIFLNLAVVILSDRATYHFRQCNGLLHTRKDYYCMESLSNMCDVDYNDPISYLCLNGRHYTGNTGSGFILAKIPHFATIVDGKGCIVSMLTHPKLCHKKTWYITIDRLRFGLEGKTLFLKRFDDSMTKITVLNGIIMVIYNAEHLRVGSYALFTLPKTENGTCLDLKLLNLGSNASLFFTLKTYQPNCMQNGILNVYVGFSLVIMEYAKVNITFSESKYLVYPTFHIGAYSDVRINVGKNQLSNVTTGKHAELYIQAHTIINGNINLGGYATLDFRQHDGYFKVFTVELEARSHLLITNNILLSKLHLQYGSKLEVSANVELEFIKLVISKNVYVKLDNDLTWPKNISTNETTLFLCEDYGSQSDNISSTNPIYKLLEMSLRCSNNIRLAKGSDPILPWIMVGVGIFAIVVIVAVIVAFHHKLQNMRLRYQDLLFFYPTKDDKLKPTNTIKTVQQDNDSDCGMYLNVDVMTQISGESGTYIELSENAARFVRLLPTANGADETYVANDAGVTRQRNKKRRVSF